MEKKYALPYRVVDAVVAHFMRFLEDARIMPVIWHQSLLAFVQRLENFVRHSLACHFFHILFTMHEISNMSWDINLWLLPRLFLLFLF